MLVALILLVSSCNWELFETRGFSIPVLGIIKAENATFLLSVIHLLAFCDQFFSHSAKRPWKFWRKFCAVHKGYRQNFRFWLSCFPFVSMTQTCYLGFCGTISVELLILQLPSFYYNTMNTEKAHATTSTRNVTGITLNMPNLISHFLRSANAKIQQIVSLLASSGLWNSVFRLTCKSLVKVFIS